MATKKKQQKRSAEPIVIPEHDSAWTESAWRSRTRKRLLDWFDTNKRTMPWRVAFDPPRSQPIAYHVWVSEIMLQQTQVATVIPYFERFLKQFPTLQHLASAEEAVLMRLWEGLGYYRRARALHAGAKQIVELHDGVFPTTYDEVLALPGVGRYTAGAILSISQDAKLPILEGNTVRVFSRWIAMRGEATAKPANQLLWQVAEKMLPRKGSGRFNQAAMELGALICTPRDPKCDQCPLKNSCRAHHLGLENVIPGKVTKTKYEDRTEFALVLQRPSKNKRGGRGKKVDSIGYLMRPLPKGGRWAGLWDFPRPTEDSYDSLGAVETWLSKQLGADVATGPRLKTIKHAVTKYRISLHVHSGHFTAPKNKLPKPWQYVTTDEMSDLPMSVTARKICDYLQKVVDVD